MKGIEVEELKTYKELYVFTAFMSYGESILMSLDRSGQAIPMVYRKESDIPLEAYEYVRHVVDTNKVYVELKKYVCETTIQQFFPGNVVSA